MNNTICSLFPSTEIMLSFLSHECSKNASLLADVEKDAKATIFTWTNFDFKETDIVVVKNTKTEMALVLPYYTQIDTASALWVADDELNAVGGEILAAALGVLGYIGATLGIGAAVGTATISGFSTAAVLAGAAVVAAPIAGMAAVVGGAGTIAAIASIDKSRVSEIRNNKAK